VRRNSWETLKIAINWELLGPLLFRTCSFLSLCFLHDLFDFQCLSFDLTFSPKSSRWWPHKIQAQQTGMQGFLLRGLLCVSSIPLNWVISFILQKIKIPFLFWILVYFQFVIVVVLDVCWGKRFHDEDSKAPSSKISSWGSPLAESNHKSYCHHWVISFLFYSVFFMDPLLNPLSVYTWFNLVPSLWCWRVWLF